MLAKKKPVFVFDLMNEYGGGGAKDVPAAWNHYMSFEDFLTKNRNRVPARGVHVIAWKKDTDIIQGIHLFRSLEKPVALVFEEMHALFRKPSLKKDIEVPLDELTFYGRHYGVDVVLITQRPKSLPTDVRSQIPFCISFRQTLSSDLDSLSEISEQAGKVVIDLQERYFYAFGQQPEVFSDLKINEVTTL